MIRCSLHNHTNFADGIHTPGQMADAAWEMGLSVFGISEHAPFPQDPEAGMALQDVPCYVKEMEKCREKYRGKMEVLCGIEQDIYSPPADRAYDYVIGSAHYVIHDGIYCCVDLSDSDVQRVIREVYHGEGLALAEEYYATVARVVDEMDCDIIGHFDLVTKFNEGNRLFDMTDRRYRDAVMQALEVLIPKEMPFEINTGAIARGYRKEPYPQTWILKELAARGARILLSSDAHRKENICFGFEKAAQLAMHCGFRTVAVLEGGIWRERPIMEAW